MEQTGRTGHCHQPRPFAKHVLSAFLLVHVAAHTVNVTNYHVIKSPLIAGKHKNNNNNKVPPIYNPLTINVNTFVT